MADISKINGNNLKDASAREEIADLKEGTVAAGKATKLATPRTITLVNAASGSVNFDGSANVVLPVNGVKEAYLEWGGRNISGSFRPLDAALVPELGANRLAFGKAAGITIEYSRDSGATWIDYGADDYAKTALFSTGTNLVIGKADSTNKATAAYMLRVTIDTDVYPIYTILNKFVVYISTNGSTGCYCTIDASFEATPDTWNIFADKAPISGWSGYNIINVSGLITYGNLPSSHYGKVRFTFGCTGGSDTYNGLQVLSIYGYGGVGWLTPSTMAKTGLLYSFDANQNATFPAKVKANGGFEGNLTGSSTALKFVKSNEIVFDGTPSTPYVWIGYSYVGGAGKEITEYRFANGLANGGYADVRAKTFIGALDGSASMIDTVAGTDNVERNVFFANSTSNQKVCFDNDFTYNPYTNTLKVANITGNASSATNATNATNAINAANADKIYIYDSRKENELPYASGARHNRGISADFKANSTIGCTSAQETYSLVTTFSPWSDKSGGYPVQLLTNGYIGENPVLAVRTAATDSTWGDWYDIITAANIGEQNVASAIHADTATKAITDAEGNIIQDTYIKVSSIGAKVGVAPLDNTGKIASSYLPSYVDDVMEYASKASFPTTGESGKIYVDTSTNLTWRWSGTTYIEISPSLALGETSSTAYAGDKGKANADEIANIKSTYATKDLTDAIQNTATQAYSVASSAKTKADNNATNITALQSKFTTMDYLEISGKAYLNNAVVDYAASAGSAAQTIGDKLGQDITETYIKGIEYSNEGSDSGNICLTLTTGRGETLTVDLPYDTYTLPKATSSALGGMKVGYTASGKNYPVVLDANGNAYVNVPWVNTDTNTTYTAGTGLQLSGTTFNLVEASSTALGGVKLGYTDNTNARLYAVKADGNGNAYVSVPWSDTNTHYTSYLYAGASGTQTNGTTTNGNTYLKLVESDIIRSSRLIKGTGATTVTSDSSGNITINTPGYSLPAATSSSLGGIKTGYSSTDNYRAMQLDSSNNGYVYIPSGSTSQAGLISATDKTYLDKAMRVSGAYMYANATSGNGSSYQGYYDFINSEGKRLKLVWGFTAASSGKMTVSFRSAFPNACIGVWMSLYNTNSDNSLPGYKITARSSTSFTAYCMYRQLNGQGWESQPWFWIAIGY